MTHNNHRSTASGPLAADPRGERFAGGFSFYRKAKDVPKKSNRIRRLGERVLVAGGEGMWQAGKIARIIEGEQGAVVYVVTLKNGRQVRAPANAVNPDPQRPRQPDPTPEQIQKWREEIQREWPDEVRQQRDMRARPVSWSVPRSHYLRGTQTGRADFEH